MSLDEVVMPFGKYRGEKVFELPRRYLDWLYINVTLNPELAEAVTAALLFEDDDPLRANVIDDRFFTPSNNPGPGWERWGSGWKRRK